MNNTGQCRFQNTLKDLMDCHDWLYDDDLSEEEERARKMLIKICCDIADEVEEDDH